MNQNIYTQEITLERSDIGTVSNDIIIAWETCAQETFNRNFFTDNFLGVYLKAFELATIFFR